MDGKDTHLLRVEVYTQEKNVVIGRLKALMTTVVIEDMGELWEDPVFSALNITTTKTDVDMDRWLWSHHIGCREVYNLSSSR